MRANILTLLCLTVTLSPAQAPGGAAADEEKKFGTIEGKLVDSSSGEPVRKANVSLMQIPSGGGGMTFGPPPTTAISTDAEGKFVFPKVEPGRYMLSAEKTGYVRQQYGSRNGQFGPGTNLTVDAGQRVGGIEFRLVPQAVITGKVLDEEGEPVAHAMVSVLRQMPFSKQPGPMMGMGSNDVGEFRIANLAPGKYMIRVEYRGGMFGNAAPAPAADPKGEGTMGYVATYYPGVTDLASAAPITVTAGQQLSGLNVQLRKSRVFQVSGKVQGAPTGTRLQVNLQPAAGNSPFTGFGFGGGGNVKPDGTFLVQGVLPGSYDVVAMGFDGGRPQFLGRTPLTVGNSNVEGVTVQSGSPLDLSGRIIVEGEGAPAVTGQVTVQAVERLPVFAQPTRIGEDGSFKIAGVPREKVQVQIFGLPAELYVKSVRAGDADVTDSGIDLSRMDSAPPIEVRVSSKGASVDGVVMAGDKPAAGAVVMLFPHPLTRTQSAALRKTASTDQNGRFSIKGIRPGEYRAYASDSYIPVNDMDAEQLKPFEKFAAPVKLKEEGKEQLELKLAAVQEE